MNKWDSETLQWENLQQKENCPPCPRFGHTMEAYKDKLYIFGGMLKIKRMKSLTNEINIFNTSKNNI